MLKRPYANGPAAVPVSTPLGLLYVRPTSASHLYCNTDPDGPAQAERNVFTVRGVPYRVRVHAFLNAAGEWTHVSDERDEDPEHQRAWKARERTYSNLSATRTDGGKGHGIMRDEASDAARKSLADAILPVVNAWTRTPEGAALIAEAQRASLSNALLACEEEEEETRAAHAAATLAMHRARALLAEAGGDLDGHRTRCRFCEARVSLTADMCAECLADARKMRRAQVG